MLENYPFAQCLNPQTILNPYTKDWITVPCGHCRQCMMNKSNRLAFQCTLEGLSNKYGLFITLTYDEKHLPRLRIVRDEDTFYEDLNKKNYYFIDSESSEVVFTQTLSDSELETLFSKVNTYDNIPYLRKSDLQNWFKRLRKAISKFTSSKVRYFACGEYGPLHLRPHYHILLWFDDKEIFKVCDELIYKTWRYGRIDCQLTQGKASNYVASYVNSNCALPSFYQFSSIRPFSTHSRFLGQRILALSREKVYATSPDEFINVGFPINGTYTSFRLWLSCYSVFYPKCKGFFAKSPYELYYSYTIYELAKKRYPTADNCFKLAQAIYEHLSYTQQYTPELRKFPNEVDTRFYNYFAEYVVNPDSVSDEDIDRQVRNIYKDLLNSRHFLTFVCNSSTDYQFRMNQIYKITDFYNYLRHEQLIKFYEQQELYFSIDLSDTDDIVFFYDNFPDSNNFGKSLTNPPKSLSNNWLYKQFSSKASIDFRRRTKHKELNDANNMLFNGNSDSLYVYDPTDLFCK